MYEFSLKTPFPDRLIKKLYKVSIKNNYSYKKEPSSAGIYPKKHQYRAESVQIGNRCEQIGYCVIEFYHRLYIYIFSVSKCVLCVCLSTL